MQSTEWCPVVGFEGIYEVSARGDVRSLKYGKLLKQHASGRGYAAVSLCRDARPRTTYVHHIVAAAFIGPRPPGLEICHKNGVMTDNSASNLRYGTHASNMRDAIMHGTHRVASRTHCVNGHKFSSTNVWVVQRKASDGGVKTTRMCKACQRARTARYLERAARSS